MKNVFKFGFLAFAISLSVAACKGGKSTSTTDSTKVDSTTSTTTVDTMKKDSAVMDTMKKDTTKKM